MGSYSEAQAVARVWSRLRDYGNTTDQQLLNDTEVADLGLRGAEPIYSRIRPRTAVSNLTADGSNFLALPVGYIEGFSSVVSLESPPDEVPPNVIDSRLWSIGYSSTGALRIVWDGFVPANGAAVRLLYSGPRTFNAVAANSTILDTDFTAVCDLAASLCADSIAAKYARTSEPAFSADVVNYRTRAQEWQSIAKALWSAWERGIGLIGGGGDGGGAMVPPASAYANWDAAASWGGSHINHPTRGR